MKHKIFFKIISIIICMLTLFSCFIFSVSASESATDTQDVIYESPLFSHNGNKTLVLTHESKDYTLYSTDLILDLNDDGKCNASEARELMRISASLASYRGEISDIDINSSGTITSADARLVLRYSAKLDVYYTLENLHGLTGFSTDKSGNTYYFYSFGLMAIGLATIDDSLYYFDADRKMCTGIQNVNGIYYHFDENGKGSGGTYTENGVLLKFDEKGKSYNGIYTENNKQYYYVNGAKYTGWYSDGTAYRYYNTDGSMATGKVTIDGSVYCFDSTGNLMDGFVTTGGKTYYYTGGKMLTGKQTIDGKIYYFHTDGHMAKNETVDGIVYDSFGAASKADKSFFNDAVFIGDSVSVKLAAYHKSTKCFGTGQVYAATSLSAANALWEISSKSVHPKYNGNKTLVEDCVRYSGAKKVFIMLGMNDIGIYSFDDSINNYKTLISRIKAKSPNVDIYIQSMTPMTAISTRADSRLNNTNIKLYNQRLKQMCEEMSWHYLDVASALYDSTGTYLTEQYCSDPVYMGLHLTDAGCEKWVEYLYENAAFV